MPHPHTRIHTPWHSSTYTYIYIYHTPQLYSVVARSRWVFHRSRNITTILSDIIYTIAPWIHAKCNEVIDNISVELPSIFMYNVHMPPSIHVSMCISTPYTCSHTESPSLVQHMMPPCCQPHGPDSQHTKNCDGHSLIQVPQDIHGPVRCGARSV